MRYTLDNLTALDAEVQIAADRRLLAELTVARAGIPETGEPLFPGVPEGAEFAAPAANPELRAAMVELGWVRPAEVA